MAAACVDTGGHHTQSAYAFAREHYARRVFATKVMAGPRPLWPRNPSRNNAGRVPLFLIGVDSAKELAEESPTAIAARAAKITNGESPVEPGCEEGSTAAAGPAPPRENAPPKAPGAIPLPESGSAGACDGPFCDGETQAGTN